MRYKFDEVEVYFKERFNNIEEIMHSGKDFEAALVALCYIDALASLFQEGTTMKSRFINLLFSHGTIDGFRWDKINIAEFRKMEARSNLKSNICKTCYEKIKLYFDQRICDYEYCSPAKCLEKDKLFSQEIDDIIKFSNEKDCRCNVISEPLLRCLDDSTYAGILYREYRCEAVHKGKFNMSWSSLEKHFEKPHYVDVDNQWPDFSIPPKFIIQTLEKCLLGLKNNNK
ncbi:hypothetical protein ACFL2G_05295 [Candidatus Omnitrophota bacterium]